MTTINNPWSLGSCQNKSLNNVEPAVPPQIASDPNTSSTINGRSAPANIAPDAPNNGSTASVLQSLRPGAVPTGSSGQSEQSAQSKLLAALLGELGFPVPFDSIPYVADSIGTAPNQLTSNDIDPAYSSVRSVKITSNVQNPTESSQISAVEADTTAQSTAQLDTDSYVLPSAELSSIPNQLQPEGFRLDLHQDSALPNKVRSGIPDPNQPSPAAHALTASSPSSLPAPGRARKERAYSFAAGLSTAQRVTLFGWLGDTELSLADIQRRVAAPAPEGFGIRVNHNTIRRLRALLHNQQLQHWLDEAMDAACDLLDPAHAAQVAPLRESLIQILYSQAIQKTRHGFYPRELNQCVAAIERLEKMKCRSSTRSAESYGPIAQVQVDLKVRPAKTKKPRVKIVSAAPPARHRP